ncbi:MAG: hypothetical protein NTZ69_16385 [Bacteroidia bacterium]|nr:hypothetical protein [Bacteroidia bacterium]
MKKIVLLFSAFLVSYSVYSQKNTLVNPPDYQIYKDNVDKLLPAIPITNKSVKNEPGISEKLEIQSFQKTADNNDININVEVTKYTSNPLNMNPFAMFAKTARTLDEKLSLTGMAFIHFEGDSEDDITKNEKNRIFSQVNIDPEENTNFRVKKGGEKMKKKEFGMDVDAMFNYVNSLLKGSFHDAEAKWDKGKQFNHFYFAAAGNVLVKVQVYAYKTDPKNAPDARAIAEGILKKLPQDRAIPIETNIEVYPKFTFNETPNENGLIPASPLLPAKVIYKVGKSNVNVTFSLLVNCSGELRSETTQGKSISVISDAKGDAVVWYYYTDQNDIKAPVKITIVAEAEGKSKKAFVNVGLGLAFDGLKEIPEQVYIYSKAKPYAFKISVKSLFYPKLNIALYARAANESQIWGSKKIGVELVCTWINKPDDAEEDYFFVGSTFIECTKSDNVTNVLVATHGPNWEYYTDYSYPAVTLRSEGTHIYKVNGKLAVINDDSKDKNMIGLMNEPMANCPALIPLSSEYPERWYKSFACALATVDSEQKYLLVEAAKLIPTLGLWADVPMTASQFVCGLINGDYEKSILDLASWLGGQYIDNLSDKKVFDLLNTSKQNAVLAAKAAYFGTDQYKKKGELEQIREKQKNRAK